MQKENSKPITMGTTIMSIFKSFMVFVLIMLLSAVFAPIAVYLFPNIPLIIQAYIAMIVVYLVTLLIMFFVKSDGTFFKQYKEKLHIRKFPPFDILKIIGFVLLTFMGASTINGILSFILKSGTSSQNANVTTQVLINGLPGAWKIFGVFIIPILIAPFFEEAIFRQGMGYLFKIDQGGSKIAYVITESLFFGLLHLQTTGSPLAMVQAVAGPMVGGIIFGILYCKYRTFWYSYITHSSYNLIVVIITLAIAAH